MTVREAVAFLGPGAMGRPMVRKLIDTGYEVHVWARRSQPVDELVECGAIAAKSPADAAAEADVVVGCLLGDDVVQEIYAGEGGVLARARPGQLYIEHATFSPKLATKLAALASERGASFIDAPVSGGPGGAEAGTLVSMIGGESAQIDRARTVVNAYCKRIVQAGPIGAGSTLKLINQLLVAAHSVAAAEAAAMIREAGLDSHAAHSALMGGWAGSVMLDILLPRALAEDFDGQGASIGGLIPVLELVREQMEALRIDPLVLPAAQETIRAAALNYSDAGLAALIVRPLHRVYGVSSQDDMQ